MGVGWGEVKVWGPTWFLGRTMFPQEFPQPQTFPVGTVLNCCPCPLTPPCPPKAGLRVPCCPRLSR